MARIFDTDHLSILQTRSQPAYGKLQGRLALAPVEPPATTVISMQEQFRGAVAYLNAAQLGPNLLTGYERLVDIYQFFATLTLLPFTQTALDQVEVWRKQKSASAPWTCASPPSP
jgi:hypothetical protein